MQFILGFGLGVFSLVFGIIIGMSFNRPKTVVNQKWPHRDD